jgi:hypothetical protein
MYRGTIIIHVLPHPNIGICYGCLRSLFPYLVSASEDKPQTFLASLRQGGRMAKLLSLLTFRSNMKPCALVLTILYDFSSQLSPTILPLYEQNSFYDCFAFLCRISTMLHRPQDRSCKMGSTHLVSSSRGLPRKPNPQTLP